MVGQLAGGGGHCSIIAGFRRGRKAKFSYFRCLRRTAWLLSCWGWMSDAGCICLAPATAESIVSDLGVLVDGFRACGSFSHEKVRRCKMI